MSENSNLSLILHPQEFFKEQVSYALAQHNIKAEPEVEFYLVNLLCNFIDPSKSGFTQGDESLLDVPLALQLKNALEAPANMQHQILKNMADTSLYIAGYFQDYFNRKAFDINYFITLGSSAYESVGNLLKDKGENRSTIFFALADKFGDFVEVYAIISDQLGFSGPENILATYDRWIMNQNSDRLRKKLEKSGINPIPINLKIAQ